MKSKSHEYIDPEKDLMNKKIWYILLLASVFFFSCRKKNFPENITPGQSDFYFTGNIAGSNVSLKAGIDNYYMHSSYALDSNGLYSFIADLKPSDCSNCKNSLQIRINDFRLSSQNAVTKIDSSLLPKTYPLSGGPFYAVKFKSLSNQPASSYLWNFGDNSSSTEANPLHIYKATGNYSLSLRVNSIYGCQQYVSNIERIKYPVTTAKISVTNSSANSMSFNALISGSSLNNYKWSFGDGDSSSVPSPTHLYKTAGTYPVILRVMDERGDVFYTKYNVATQTNPMPCLSNYSIESVEQIANPLPFSNVTINWTDENGNVYTSDNASQPSISNFKIISVEDYDPNERGEKTKKIRINFTCQVFNGTQIKSIDNAEAVLCVSYK